VDSGRKRLAATSGPLGRIERTVETLPHTATAVAEPDANYRIRVEVETSYLEEQSAPRERKYVFAYTITLRNEGRVSARLLTRHWIITDANGKVQEVRGDGVVGEQPHLKPGQGFRYSSGAMIETPVGAMQGSYQMVADDGARFDAPIAPFRLAMPGILQ
jgi:ApaG protein